MDGVRFSRVSHVIFDMDGLLLDTERLYTEATQLICDRFGKEFTWDIKVKQMGKKLQEAAPIIINDLELPITAEQYMTDINKLYDKLFPTSEMLPGAERLVRHLHMHHVPIAVATGCSELNYNMKVQLHRDLFGLFHHVVWSSDDPDVKHGKPAPDCFLVAASRFEGKIPQPEQVLVFEDAPNGVLGALAAGMPCVWVPDDQADRSTLSDQTTLTINSLAEFKPEDFGLPPYETLPYKPVTHVIFDMDGLLLNTELLYGQIYQAVCDRHDKTFTWEMQVKQMGMNNEVSAKMTIDELGLPMCPDEWTTATNAIAQKVFPQAELLPGAERLVRHLSKHGIPVAVATGSTRSNYNLKIGRHRQLFGLFHHEVLGSDDPEVERGKPAPDIFLITAGRFNDNPASGKVLVFEDSPNGVRSAHSAGMQCVWVPDPRQDRTQLQNEATIILDSLRDFRPQDFGLPFYT